MRPPKQRETAQFDMLRSRLHQIINLEHELVRLGREVAWGWIDEEIAPLFSDKGRPGLPSRFAVGLLLLKHIYNLSDEQVCDRWVYDPYFQYFTGEEFFQPAVEVEEAIKGLAISLLSNPGNLISHTLSDDVSSATKQVLLTAVSKTLLRIKDSEAGRREFIRGVISKVVVSADEIVFTFEGNAMLSRFGVTEASRNSQPQFTMCIPIRVTRSGRQKRMIIVDDKGEHRLVNDGMVMAIARALKWDTEIRAGSSLREIARREDLSATYVTRVLPLAFLAPDIVQAVYEGRQPISLKVKELSANLPLEWTEQRRALGLAQEAIGQLGSGTWPQGYPIDGRNVAAPARAPCQHAG